MIAPAVDLTEGSVLALVLDTHPVTRIGLGVLVQRAPWVSRCLLAADRDEAVALAERHRLDVAIVDISEAGASMSAYLAPLRAARPAMPIVLSSLCAPAGPAQRLAAGGAEVLTAELSVEQLLGAIRAALLGDEAPPPLTVQAQAQAQIVLSARERQVLALLCDGATNREIAAAMHVGTDTVKKHAASLYRKLGVRNRTEAARQARALLSA
jgi:DNA-binding NarL/FixJ family response regulator